MQRLSTHPDSGGHGPCASFNFVTEKNYKCPAHPALNPDTRSNPRFFLSIFAHEWITYTCCQIVTEPLRGIIASVWMWLQVCTQAMTTIQVDPRLLSYDDLYARNNASYEGGPLKDMKHYCPTDLDGGELSEWVVTTFFPVCICLSEVGFCACVNGMHVYIHADLLYLCGSIYILAYPLGHGEVQPSL